ncbi:tumor protein p53-inducible protein 13 isoform X2 [Scyliorhinus canicula]|nr:tumor protein p53-inducible protein 13 isoform X2 [Scyliorhinus canicula]
MHRPIWAMYGEYAYVPPQRWVHNLQRGGIAFLYHPCVHPRLKEELSLLARACTYKHIITPHLNLSQQWPLALVAWGRSLEMSKINLAEAVTWLRGNGKRARNLEIKDDGAYDYQLIWRAKLAPADNGRVVCPEKQMKELQHYLGKGELQSAIRKWNKVGVNVLSKGRRVILRRRRRNSGTRDLPPTSAKVERTASFSAVLKRDNNSANNTSFVNPEVLRSQPHVPAVIGGVSQKGVESRTRESQGSKKGANEIGGGQNRKKDGLKSTLLKEVTTPTLKEPPVSEAFQQTSLSGSDAKHLKTGDLTVKRPNSPPHHQELSTSEDNPSQERIKSGDSIPSKADGQMAENAAIKQQQIAGIVANINHVPDSQGLDEDTSHTIQNGSKLSGNGVKPQQPLHSSEISSKNDVGAKQSEDTDKSYPGEVGSDRTLQKVEVGEKHALKTNETAIANALDGHNETAALDSGNVKCKCEDGASRPHGTDSNNLKAGALQKTQRRVEERTLYIPTPRTEEAAWAAAALAFLFVFLTLAVLYTRLYRKFIKSDSLYWAPVPGTDWQESVADVVKRRLNRSGKRWKKRPPQKKKSISPYGVLPSDNSD